MTKTEFDPDPNATDYYARLGVPISADRETIEEAGKKATSEYHPDRNTDVDEQTAADNFDRITQARAVLTDDSARRAYDTFLERFGTEAGTEVFDRWDDRGRPASAADWTPPSNQSTSAKTNTQTPSPKRTKTKTESQHQSGHTDEDFTENTSHYESRVSYTATYVPSFVGQLIKKLINSPLGFLFRRTAPKSKIMRVGIVMGGFTVGGFIEAIPLLGNIIGFGIVSASIFFPRIGPWFWGVTFLLSLLTSAIFLFLDIWPPGYGIGYLAVPIIFFILSLGYYVLIRGSALDPYSS